MSRTLSKRFPVFIVLAALLCAVEMWIAASPVFLKDPFLLSFAVTVDILLGIPTLYYVLVVRTGRVPAISLAPVFLLSVLVAGYIIPATHQNYLDVVREALPLVEVGLLAYAAFKVRSIARYYREARPGAVYPSDALEAGLRKAVGDSPAVGIITTELSLVYYAFLGWFKRYKVDRPDDLAFSYHRNSPYGAFLIMIALVLPVETAAVHLILQIWSSPIAWAATALSAYSLIWLLGDYGAIRLHPIVLRDGRLYLRAGFRGRATVDVARVLEVRKATATDRKAPEYANFAIVGDPRLVIELSSPVTIHGLFGRRKQARLIGLSVDDEKRFLEELRNPKSG